MGQVSLPETPMKNFMQTYIGRENCTLEELQFSHKKIVFLESTKDGMAAAFG
jgi:hypothetical protein